jgi:hypothetical protein
MREKATTRCDHKKAKVKLVAWATDCKGEHEQGFRRAKCCAKCGCLWQTGVLTC